MDRDLQLAASTAARLTRAKAYPYETPGASFAFVAGKALQLVRLNLESPLDSAVIDNDQLCSLRSSAKAHGLSSAKFDAPPMLLLAYGSNASVEALSRKFGDHEDAAVLPVARATLQDFDIVYSSHISPYGAIPAALQFCPHATTTVHVLVATETQQRILRNTEPNYFLASLSGLDLRFELGPSPSNVAAYLTRHGMLSINGTEVAVAAVETQNRSFPALTEEEVLLAARDVTAPGDDIDHFILQNSGDEALSRLRTERLKENARPFRYSAWNAIGH